MAMAEGVDSAAVEGSLHLEEMRDAVVLVDPRLPGLPIAAASDGFLRLTGGSPEELLGHSSSSLSSGVPSIAVSRSAQKNFEDFCKSSLLPGVADLAESWHIHPYARKDGSLFNSFVMLGFCRTRLGPYVAMVHLHLCEGMVAPRVGASQAEQLYEEAREAIKRTRQHLASQEAPEATPLHCGDECKAAAMPGTFFKERLQDRSILLANARSAARREPSELPVGCLLFGGAPMVPARGKGLQFALRVDEVNQAFEGLPLLGFTRRRPADEANAYPSLAKCLGRSVLIGGAGEASARDQEEHFKVGFRKIPESEVASWTLPKGELARRGLAQTRLSAGDIVECHYTCQGSIQFWLNGAKLFDFDVGRPLEDQALYWPVVDVAFSVSAVTWLGRHSSRLPSLQGDSLAQAATVGNLSTVAPTSACFEEENDEDSDAVSVFSESSSCLGEDLGDDGGRGPDVVRVESQGAAAQSPPVAQPSAVALDAERSSLRGGSAGRALLVCAAAAAAAVAVAALGRGSRRSP